MNPLYPTHNHTYGLRPNALWHEELEGFEGRVVNHGDWASCRDALTAEGRRVHDFFFRNVDPALVCDACEHSGCSLDYLEFESGFLPSGGGRWSGWGLGPYSAEEAELLVESRLSSRLVGMALSTPELLDEAQAMLVREVAGPVRATALGIPVECQACGGQETEYDELLVWSFGENPTSGRIDVVHDVSEVDHPDIKRFMREAYKEIVGRLVGNPGRIGWDGDERGFDGIDGAWFMCNERVPSFQKFADEVGPADERNLLFDVHIVPTVPGRCMLRFWMTHPARGYGREILVEDASDADADALASILADHCKIHERNFGWAFQEAGGASAGCGDVSAIAFANPEDGRAIIAELMARPVAR